MRRYLLAIQDPAGYPSSGRLVTELPPRVEHVVLASEHDAEIERLRGALKSCANAMSDEGMNEMVDWVEDVLRAS